MSVFHNNALIGAGAGTGEAPAAAEYVIPKSLRFNDGDSAYLSKTFSTAGNQQTWTWSAWIKRASFGINTRLFDAYSAQTDTGWILLGFNTSDQLFITGWSTVWKVTSQVFRDPSAFFHLVVAFDVTESTGSDRIKFYINGTQVTAFATNNSPAQNTNHAVNGATTHEIGRYSQGQNQYFDGLMADIQFVDGQALAPSDFGETRSSDGVWVPKEYTGSYGPKVNQTQNWTALGTGDATSPYRWEETFDGDSSTYGAIPPNGQAALVDFSSLSGGGISYTSSVVVTYNRNTNAPDVTVNGSAIGATADGTERTYTLSGSGTLTSVGTQTRTAGGAGDCGIKKIVVDGAELVDSGITLSHNGFHLNFSDSSTNEALGFDSAPTIPDADPKKGMDVVTYSGTGAVQNIGGLGFEPGLIWIKSRSNSNEGHYLYDSVRGANKALYSHATVGEGSSTNQLNTFNPDGFTLGSNGAVNSSSHTFVAWTWRAGGPAVTKTAGTIDAEVSANTDYGFSICKFTGTGTAGTIEHGLSTVPKWYMVKSTTRSNAEWNVYHASRGETKRLKLNSNSAEQVAALSWNNTAPTASLFTVGTDTDVNASGDGYVAYVWSEVAGFSKFGSYAGSGASGKQVTGLGFKPRYLLVKAYDASASWVIVDSERGGDKLLFAEASNADSSGDTILFLDDGFQIQGGGGDQNYSGRNYVYMAFADRPGNNWDVNNIVTNEGLTTSKTQFDVVTYSGTGSQQSISSLAFQPDLVWTKRRDGSSSHGWFDSVRGATKWLGSNSTNSEQTYSDSLTSFNSNGFTLGADTAWNGINQSSQTYVAWCWKAGGTAVSNTDGSITSSVSANSAYGFSIVTFTTSTAAFSVGHGLSTTPKLVIHKDRDNSYIWTVYHADLGPDKYLTLNSTAAASTSSGQFGTGPTDSVVNFSSGYANNNDGVCYCFADIPGYQRVGQYTGNGSSTGPVIPTGFKPRFLMVKRTDSTGSWVMLDSEINPANPLTKSFYAEAIDGEYTPGQNWADFDESSFQITATYGEVNASSGTYIYLAIGDDEIGSDEDCLVDVPNAVTADADATDTTGGYQRGNYATLNPLQSGLDLTNGNLSFNIGTRVNWKVTTATIHISSGKWYWEVTSGTNNDSAGANTAIGIRPTSVSSTTQELGYNDGGGKAYFSNGGTRNGGSSATASYGASFGTGDVISVAFDADNGTLEFYKNGVSQGTAFTGLTGTWAPAVGLYTGGTQVGTDDFHINFGQMRFKYPIPSGYAALNTTALPAATIADGSDQFDVKTYDGNGGTQTISGLGFSPDLVWVKRRNAAIDHILFDAVRGFGANKELTPNDTYVEGGTGVGQPNTDVWGYVDSVTSDGFVVEKGSNSTGSAANTTGGTYVGWTWNAGANSNKTYTVKVVSDSGNKYRFDDFGTSAVTLDLAEGGTYVFDQSDSSNSGHPLRFSTTSDGTHNSGYEYTTGVTTTGTPGSAGAKTTIVVASGAPVLHYYCSAHSGMGGQANTNSTAGASNFDGSIQSTVKANPEAGFSIVSYVGTGNNDTVGHGLNAAPELMLIKNRDVATDWDAYHVATGESKYLVLNGTNAAASSSWMQDTAPTNSVYSVASGTYAFNRSGNDIIAYCFTPVAGYSAFGSYTGNGSTDGPFVHTGFKIRWLMVKRSDSTGDWFLLDTARSEYNVANTRLWANLNSAESSSSVIPHDILSNGFKVRNSETTFNASGGTFIYAAFAENPFQANGGLAR